MIDARAWTARRRHDQLETDRKTTRDDLCRRLRDSARLPALRRAARRRRRGAGAAPAATSTFRWSPASPWLFAEPNAALGEWRGRLHFSLQRLERERQQLAAALASTTLRPATRARLESLERATRDHGARLRALLAPLEIEQHAASYETYLALRTRLPADQGLTTYYANIHRDWCWGDAENEASFEMLAALLGATRRRATCSCSAPAPGGSRTTCTCERRPRSRSRSTSIRCC